MCWRLRSPVAWNVNGQWGSASTDRPHVGSNLQKVETVYSTRHVIIASTSLPVTAWKVCHPRRAASRRRHAYCIISSTNPRHVTIVRYWVHRHHISAPLGPESYYSLRSLCTCYSIRSLYANRTCCPIRSLYASRTWCTRWSLCASRTWCTRWSLCARGGTWCTSGSLCAPGSLSSLALKSKTACHGSYILARDSFCTSNAWHSLKTSNTECIRSLRDRRQRLTCWHLHPGS